MNTPQILRPQFPPGYVDNPKTFLTWESVEQKLREAINYWLCSVRPNARPHSIPKWAVWVNGRIYFDGSPETRHARNIAQNPYVSVHLESGTEAVMMDGAARELRPTRELAQAIAAAYTAKYKSFGYAPEPHQWDEGGLFEIQPHTVLAWTKFNEDPTKFVFE